MILFKDSSADRVWRQAVNQLRSTAPTQESRDQSTRELLHAAFTITDPRQRVIFGRPIDPAFAIIEVIWIMAGANALSFLTFWNPRMKQFSDNQRTLHGAYGYRLSSQPRLSANIAQQLRLRQNSNDTPRHDQLKAACETLRHTPHSRQVVLQIWDSPQDTPDPDPRSKDIPCNVMSHLLLRNGKLEWLQVMRSNDLIWGTPYNFIQFTSMQEIMAGWLGVEVGSYNHISDSLHVYERHWQDLATFDTGDLAAAPLNAADLRIESYGEWETVWSRLVDGALELTQHENAADLLAVQQSLSDLPPAYREWVALLTSEALRRRGHASQAATVIEQAGQFWATSWKRWAASLADK